MKLSGVLLATAFHCVNCFELVPWLKNIVAPVDANEKKHRQTSLNPSRRLLEAITQDNIYEAVWMWVDDKETALETYGPIEDWDVSGINEMSYLFHFLTEFNEDLSKWDVSSVTDMRNMFSYSRNFNGDISTWDVSNVEYFDQMFAQSHAFNADISVWDVSSAKDMSGMFFESYSFNRDLNSWNVGNVRNMNSMFYNAISFEGNVPNWDVHSVQDFSYMFDLRLKFPKLQVDIARWEIDSSAAILCMFGCAGSERYF